MSVSQTLVSEGRKVILQLCICVCVCAGEWGRYRESGFILTGQVEDCPLE